jgi:hypothetical protein
VGQCKLLSDPGSDPPVAGGAFTDGGVFQQTQGYSNEDLRAQLLCDFIHMAFTCDLSRVAALQFTNWKSYINMMAVTGHPADLHSLTHGNSNANSESYFDVKALSDGVAWHVKHFARLVGKLRDTPEVDGSRLIDNAALVLIFEGGHGWLSEINSDQDPVTQDHGSHSSENMVVLIAGHTGGLKAGKHVVATDRHPGQVVLSAMNAVGIPGDQFGEVRGNIPELFA